MLGDISRHGDSLRAAVSRVKHSHQPGRSDVAESRGFNRKMFSLSAVWLRLRLWMLLLILVFPVVICDNSLCSSEYWCVSPDIADSCSLYSMQTGTVGQLCHCSDYQLNFTVCLNNVSTL